MLIHVSGIDCLPGQDDRFNAWYDDVHVPMLLDFEGMKKAQRLRRVGGDASHPQYLALYEFDSMETFRRYQDSPQLAAALEETRQSWPVKGYDRKWRVQYELFRSWER